MALNKGQRIESIEEWMGILKTFKLANGRCDTNCYVDMHTLEEYIVEKRVFYNITETTLWCYVQERDYCLGYYYVPKKSKICVGIIDFSLVICLVGTEKKYAFIREKELLDEGGAIFKKNIEYVVDERILPELLEMDEKYSEFIRKIGIHYELFQVEDYDEIERMFKERIDAYSVRTLTEKRIENMEKEKECILARTEEGRIAAACDFEIKGSVAHIENTVSDSVYSRTGVGATLFCRQLIEIFSRQVKKVFMWSWENNIKSRKMCGRFGILTGRYSKYIVFESNL